MPQTVRDWIGRSETLHDSLRLQPAHFMQATLDQDPTLELGDPLPPLWHWLYFLEAKPLRELGRDGHPEKGGFLPPVDLPRRMRAGGRFDFSAPLRIGAKVTKRATIKDIVEKDGRSGKLCFVTVLDEYFVGEELAISEEEDIVYREDPAPDAPKPPPTPAPDDAEVSEVVTPREIMLYRYSALTFNGHRIHYDVDYARDVEGYAGLVFHGPLTATLLADLAWRTFGKDLKTLRYRGVAPISGMAPFRIEGRREGKGMQLWAKLQDGSLALQADAGF